MTPNNYTLSDLFGPYPIDDRVGGWWKDHIGVANKNVDIRGYFFGQIGSEKGEKRGCLENKHDRGMRAARAQRLVAGLLQFEAEYSMDDVAIGDSNKYQNKNNEGSNEETIDSIDLNVGTSQLGNAHVLMVGVGNNVGIAKV